MLCLIFIIYPKTKSQNVQVARMFYEKNKKTLAVDRVILTILIGYAVTYNSLTTFKTCYYESSRRRLYKILPNV